MRRAQEVQKRGEYIKRLVRVEPTRVTTGFFLETILLMVKGWGDRRRVENRIPVEAKENTRRYEAKGHQTRRTCGGKKQKRR